MNQDPDFNFRGFGTFTDFHFLLRPSTRYVTIKGCKGALIDVGVVAAAASGGRARGRRYLFIYGLVVGVSQLLKHFVQSLDVILLWELVFLAPILH